MRTFIRVAWLAATFCRRNNATALQHVEMQALCALALCRAGSPTGLMIVGQARSLARRILACRIVNERLAAIAV